MRSWLVHSRTRQQLRLETKVLFFPVFENPAGVTAMSDIPIEADRSGQGLMTLFETGIQLRSS